MGSEWVRVRLGDLLDVQHGWPFKSRYFHEELTGRPIVVNIGNFNYTGGFRFESTSVKEYRDAYPTEYELMPGEILLVMTCQTAGGEILGVPARVPKDGRTYLHNQRLGRVVVKRSDLLDAEFLYWVFTWSEFNRELYSTATGTKILHTAPGRIEAFRFSLPPLPEQRAIAAILGALDDKIELNRRMNRTLEGMARALFKSWFVDFDPVRAKAAGHAPAGLKPEIAALFPDSFQDSELGEIPTGWEVGRIRDIAIEVRDTVDPASIHPETPYIGLEHIPKRCISLDAWGTADGIASGKLRFKDGDILFGKLRPYFHKVGPATIDGVCSTDIVVVRPRSDQFYGLVLGHMSDDAFVAFTDRGSSGTRMPRTKWRDMAAYPIAVPRVDVAQKFTVTARSLLMMIRDSILQSRTLAALRDALLPKLISGELRVPDAERIVEN